MAGKRKPAASESAGSQAPAGAPALDVGQIPIALDRIGLRTLTYEEVKQEMPVVPLPLGERLEVALHMDVQVRVYSAGFELYVEVHATPDPRYLPFVMKAGISAFFSPQHELPQEEILEFTGGAGIRMLFPYVREIVSSTSMRGMFGPLWLDPLSIARIPLAPSDPKSTSEP